MSKADLLKMIENLPETEIPLAKTFLEFLLSKHGSSINKKNEEYVSLQGIIQGSSVTDEDLQEIKNIWQ
jgi:hypothetical protein